MRANHTKEVLTKYTDTVYKIAFCKIKNKYLADEVFEKVFEQYIKNKISLEYNDKLKIWFIQITLNFSEKFKAKNLINSFKEINNNFFFKTKKLDNLYSSVLSLQEKYRLIFHLFYYEDLSLIEISRIFNMEKCDVELYLEKGQEFLKFKLKEDYSINELRHNYKKSNFGIVPSKELIYKISQKMIYTMSSNVIQLKEYKNLTKKLSKSDSKSDINNNVLVTLKNYSYRKNINNSLIYNAPKYFINHNIDEDLLNDIYYEKNKPFYDKHKKILNLFYIFCTIFVLSIGTYLLNNNKLKIITTLDSNKVIEHVNLSDNVSLTFNQYNINHTNNSSNQIITFKKDYTVENYLQYLSKKPIPNDIPYDLKETTKNPQTLIASNNGIILDDTFKFSFAGPNKRQLNFDISKKFLPSTSSIYSDSSIPFSDINNINIKFAYYNNIQYKCEFIYNGIGYVITSNNLSQKEFINVILSILNN